MKEFALSLCLALYPLPQAAGSNAPKKNPLVIAHRGASGYLPEHTIEAYQLAMEMGADFIEPDLVASKDGILLARHEPNIIGTTDVREHPEFADRLRRKAVDGVEREGYFVEDFTLAELKTLRAIQSRPYREQRYNGKFTIPTLTEIIAAVKVYELQTGRRVGIYPETKHPSYFREIGLPLEEKLIATLLDACFTDPQRVFIQSFEVSNLKDILSPLLKAHGLALPLVQLFDELQNQPYDYVKSGRSETYGELIQAGSLKSFVATYASGIGPWKGSIVKRKPAVASDMNGDGQAEATEALTGEVATIVQDAHAAGLLVHPYTFRDEERFLATDYPNPMAEYHSFFELGVDGVFTDFTDTAVRARSLFHLSRQ